MQTEFFAKWPLATGLKQARAASYEKAWAHVGRFLWAFALVETTINEIFVTLFNLEGSALIFIGQGSIDFRKKMALIQVGLAQNKEHNELFKRVHKFISIRNAIAHCAFGPDEDGIELDYVDKEGRVKFPKDIGGRSKDAIDDADVNETIISFEQLDTYDPQLAALWDELEKLLARVDPITDLAPRVKADMENAIANRQCLSFPAYMSD